MKSGRSSAFPYTLLLASLAVAGVAVVGLRVPAGKMPAGSWLWVLLVAASVSGGYALKKLEQVIPEMQPAPRPALEAGERNRRAAAICFGLAILIVAVVVFRLWPDYHKWEGTFLPWLAALALMAVGGWLRGAIGRPASPDDRTDRDESDAVLPQLPRSIEVAAVVLVGALAVFLRVYRLNEIPSGIYVDETNGALDALSILEGQSISPFGTAWYETPAGFVYFMAGVFKVFGANYYSLKVVSILPSVLAVLALYPLGRLLFGPIAGLAAMALFAVSRWHLTMSRWGWNETAPLAFQILATYFLVRGLREARARSFVFAGLLTGLAAYTYLSSRIVFATLVVFLVYWIVVDRDGPVASWRRHWKGILLFFFALFIAVAPLAVTYATQPFLFFNRVREISIFNEVRETHSYRPLVDNVVRHLKFFHQAGDMHGKHNLPGEPETDPVTGVLFVVGLGYGALELRDRRRGLLWIWVGFAMLGGILSVRHEAPQAYRTLAAVPAIALLAGDVLTRAALGPIWVRRRSPVPTEPADRTPRLRLATAVLLAGLLAAGAWEVGVYFGRQANSNDVRVSFNLPENYTAREVVQALEKNDTVYLSPRVFDYSPLRFLVYGVVKRKTGGNSLSSPPYHLLHPETDLPVPATGRDALFLLSAHYWPIRDYFSSFYPNARIELVNGPANLPLYVRMRVPAAVVSSLQGLRRSAAAPTRGAVEWSGGVRTDRSGRYDFVPDPDSSITVDGEPWRGERFLGRGLHDLAVESRGASSGPPRLSWKTPDGGVEPVPAQALFGVGRPHLGLVGSYFTNTSWQGEPLFRQITPILLLAWSDPDPVSGPFSARFTGALRVRDPGTYNFRIEADDGVRFALDGRVLAEGLVPNRPNAVQATAQLTAGDHPIRIDYFQNGGGSVLEFFWQPPGSAEVAVPPTALVPGE